MRRCGGGWSTRTLEARARESNMDGSESRLSDKEQKKGQDSEQDVTTLNIAKVWGDALGAEVEVRLLRGRKLRVEFVFDSPAGALAMGGQIAEKVARGSKRR